MNDDFAERLLARVILVEVEEEVARASAKHSPMPTHHHGWAVIKEELDELWEEIRKQPRDREAMRAEAIQIAAMAVRFIRDLNF